MERDLPGSNFGESLLIFSLPGAYILSVGTITPDWALYFSYLGELTFISLILH